MGLFRRRGGGAAVAGPPPTYPGCRCPRLPAVDRPAGTGARPAGRSHTARRGRDDPGRVRTGTAARLTRCRPPARLLSARSSADLGVAVRRPCAGIGCCVGGRSRASSPSSSRSGAPGAGATGAGRSGGRTGGAQRASPASGTSGPLSGEADSGRRDRCQSGVDSAGTASVPGERPAGRARPPVPRRSSQRSSTLPNRWTTLIFERLRPRHPARQRGDLAAGGHSDGPLTGLLVPGRGRSSR